MNDLFFKKKVPNGYDSHRRPAVTIKQKAGTCRGITDIIGRTYEWPVERIIVIIHENPDENAARGGILIADKQKSKGKNGQ